MQLSNKQYDQAKWWVLIFLPATAAFISGLGELYTTIDSSRLVALLNLVAVFIGSLLQISSHHYHQDPPSNGKMITT